MNNLKTFLVSLIVVISFTGCEDYLDTVPEGQVIPESVNELGLLLNDEKTMSKGFQNSTYMVDEVFIPDNVFNSNVDRPIALNGYQWKKPIYADNERDQDWRWLYSQIWTCNYILERVDDAPLEGLSESDRANVKGQALGARASAYFDLVNVYAKHYDPSTAANDLAVPIIVSTSLDQTTTLSTVEEVYTFIDKDLTLALNLINIQWTEFSYKHSRASIYGVKARMALLMENWDVAKDYAELVLAIKNDFFDYNNYKDDFDSNTDPLTFLRASHSINNIEAVFTRSNYWFYSHRVIFNTYFSSDLFNLFSNDDLRIKYFATYDADYDSYIYNLYWYCEQGITVPEMYLIIAESEARSNNPTEAMNALNKVLEKRIDNETYIPETALNAAEALTKVLNERRKELMFTGLRWIDQRRLIKTGDFTTVVTRVLNGETLTFEPTPENYIVNIPNDISINN